jgi:hypothetical protein
MGARVRPKPVPDSPPQARLPRDVPFLPRDVPLKTRGRYMCSFFKCQRREIKPVVEKSASSSWRLNLPKLRIRRSVQKQRPAYNVPDKRCSRKVRRHWWDQLNRVFRGILVRVCFGVE